MTIDRVDFTVSRQASTLDHYRRGWAPGPDVALAGMWVGAVVADANGRDYWGLRGADDFITGMTHVVSPIGGFRALQTGFDGNPPHLFEEYSTLDWFEPLQYSDDDDGVQLTYPSGRIKRGAHGFDWHDASGRWKLHGTPVSDVFVVHVPAQPELSDEAYYRHELLHVTGTIGDVEVSGFAHQDYAYGPAGLVYAQLPIARQLQGMWVSWMHEYDDGEIGGGCFWQGRDQLDFGPGYQVKNGITTAHHDFVATHTIDDDGRFVALRVAVGDDTYSFDFDTAGSPIHFFGRLTDSSSGRKPARSWCWVEYAAGMLTPEILDMAMLPYRLAREH